MDARNNRINKRRQLKRKRELRANRLAIVATIVLLILFVIFIKQRATISALESSYRDQKESQQRLKEEIKTLQEEIKRVNSLEYIEKKAREDLGMIKDGEKIYIEEDAKESKE